MSKIKICGLRRAEDIDAVNRALPDYIGFVFAPSRRRVDTATAAALKEKLDKRIAAVGVFVNEEIDTILRIYRAGIIDAVQLHSDEDDALIRRVGEICPVIKAVGVGNTLPPLPASAEYVLFDTLSARRGGTGVVFDWKVLKDYKEKPYFLAGGLSESNITDAIRLLNPFCVDVSSAAETDGIKDAEKIARIVRLVREMPQLPET